MFLLQVGKWHLGYCRPSMLPTARGFATFYGQYSHVIDYYTRFYTHGFSKAQDYFKPEQIC